MERLPHELLQEICDFLGGENESLKQVRLVNKVFADVAARRMFRSLLVYQRPDSWTNVKNIQETPHLASYVKQLEVAALPYLPCHDFEEWKEDTRPFRLSMADKPQKVAILLENYSFLPHIDTLFGLHARYAKYTHWRDGERYFPEGSHRWMAASRPNAPFRWGSRGFLTATRLPNLQGIRILGNEELWSVKNLNHVEGSPLWKANQREALTCVSNRRYAAESPSNNVHLRFTLRIMELNHVNITYLELHRYREIMLDNMLPTPALQSVRELKLELRFTSVEYSEMARRLSRRASAYALAPWLANLDSLVKLTVTQAAPIGLYVDLIELIRAAPWPKLRAFFFRSPVTTNSGFLSFVQEHVKIRNGPLHIGKPNVRELEPADGPETSSFVHRVDRTALKYHTELLKYITKYFKCKCSRHATRRKRDLDMAIAHWGDVHWGTVWKASPYDEDHMCA